MATQQKRKHDEIVDYVRDCNRARNTPRFSDKEDCMLVAAWALTARKHYCVYLTVECFWRNVQTELNGYYERRIRREYAAENDVGFYDDETDVHEYWEGKKVKKPANQLQQRFNHLAKVLKKELQLSAQTGQVVRHLATLEKVPIFQQQMAEDDVDDWHARLLITRGKRAIVRDEGDVSDLEDELSEAEDLKGIELASNLQHSPPTSPKPLVLAFSEMATLMQQRNTMAARLPPDTDLKWYKEMVEGLHAPDPFSDPFSELELEYGTEKAESIVPEPQTMSDLKDHTEVLRTVHELYDQLGKSGLQDVVDKVIASHEDRLKEKLRKIIDKNT